ncbi:MAG: MmcQ/YjbR family DNA-binding protein [Acidimicrobiales bacterium]
MAHPKMFDDKDPTLARLSEICLALPDADVKISHGRPAFFTKKIFAGYGAVLKGEHESGRFDHALIFMPDQNEAAAYLDNDRFFVPAYWGPSGWLGVDLAPSDTDWAEVAELVEDSFRATATNKLIAQLDELSQ